MLGSYTRDFTVFYNRKTNVHAFDNRVLTKATEQFCSVACSSEETRNFQHKQNVLKLSAV